MKGIMKTPWSSPKTFVSFSATPKHTRRTRNHRHVKKWLCIFSYEKKSEKIRSLTMTLLVFTTRFTPWPSACQPSLKRTSSPSSQTTSQPFRMNGGLVRDSPTGKNCTTEAAPQPSVHPPGTKPYHTSFDHLLSLSIEFILKSSQHLTIPTNIKWVLYISFRNTRW